MIHAVTVSEDGKSVKLLVHGMRLGFIHQLRADGVKDTKGESLLHNSAYYTLNEVPGGVLKSPPMPEMCSDNEMVDQAKHASEMPFTWDNGPDKKLTIGTKPGMKFDIDELTIERDTKLELTFVNEDDMLHNLVFTKPGKDIPESLGIQVLKLGLDGAKYNYIPDSPLILSHTAVVGPESSEKIFIEIPHKRGQYWFVCTIPGHSRIMNVKVNVI
jgi:azurin